ncbi:MAG: FAD-binding oxidoreductase [Thermomicrobiales bacterium]
MVTIDGISPGTSVDVSTPDEVADVLRTASINGQNVVPVGGGTALSIGNISEQVDVAIGLSSLSGVIDYQATDLMVSVRAGTTIAALSAELAAHGQELPLDIPFPDRATVGGVLATAFAGPRRFGSGTLKDLVVGCSYVRGDGLIAKAGGMVVKNVSGFEIPRLLHGSWGTLAVMTSANFKVTPIPKGDLTCSVDYSSMPDAVKAGSRVLMSGVSVVSCEIVQLPQAITLLVRLQGREEGVHEQLSDLRKALAGAEPGVDEGVASRRVWQSQVEHLASADGLVQVVIGARPRDLESLLAHLETMPAGSVTELIASPATGTVRVRLDPEQFASDHFWTTLTPPQGLQGLSMMVEFAPSARKRGLDVWGPPPAGIEIMRSIKRQFDPDNVLNRGRMMV